MNLDLDRSYAHCRQVVRRSSSNLAWCFCLLPRDQRRGMDALYAFARQADDLVDENRPADDRRAALSQFRRDLADALAGEARPPLFPALADTVRRFAVEPGLLAELLDGVALDLEPQSPSSFQELREYCYRVASVVGLACLPIWGCTDERAITPAIDCGIAFQLTNVLRDLKEDAQRGRCYLPRDEMANFGVQPCPAVGRPVEAIDRERMEWNWSPSLAELIGFQIARAKSYYESAEDTARYLPPPGRRVFHLMMARYRSILKAIERQPARIVDERISLSWPRKAVVAAGALLAPKSAIADPRPNAHKPAKSNRRPLEGTDVAIVGGGLAGMSAAVALCQRGVRVELFESRQRLGGRAGSYVDRNAGESIDHCQHVAMGCCTSFLDFCRQTGIDGCFQRHRTLHFFGPDGRCRDFRSAPWLPAPLHLGPALYSQDYLSLADRRSIARAMLSLARLPPTDEAAGPTIGQWLIERRQSPAAIANFWQVVLVSALGESLDHASLASARQVFVDGFMAARSAYEVYTPNVPLGELYDRRVADWLRQRGVAIHLGCGVDRIAERNAHRTRIGITLDDGGEREFDHVVAALPWRRLPKVLSPALASALPEVVSAANGMLPSPITAIHLWFDRPITALPHAVIVGRLAQWVFARPVPGSASAVPGRDRGSGLFVPESENCCGQHYYQVVISASRALAGRERDDVLREVLDDLSAVFPEMPSARLVRWQMITDPEAVFSVRPGLSQCRPSQKTAVPHLFLAGDWTATHWPATMEGAVRSGYLAAEALLASLGRRQRIVAPRLPRDWLARWLIQGGQD